MKKDRKIIIKNPLLRRLRSNLRIILLEAISAKIDLLYELQKEIEDDMVNLGIDSPSDSHEWRRLEDERRVLRSLIENGICQCSFGGACEQWPLKVDRWGPTDLDMAYSAIDREWYCLKCYDWIQENKEVC